MSLMAACNPVPPVVRSYVNDLVALIQDCIGKTLNDPVEYAFVDGFGLSDSNRWMNGRLILNAIVGCPIHSFISHVLGLCFPRQSSLRRRSTIRRPVHRL